MNRHARRSGWALLGLVVLLAAGEMVARLGLGLGTPPLYEADPDVEYRLKPLQSVKRFGNAIEVNRWGMRSDDFGPRKTREDELRVLVFGDSVINGGAVIDQADLATARLQRQLTAALQHPVVVGNVSAGSWGPGNWLGFARRFGWLDADLVILMVNSGDHADNPSFGPLGIDHPTEAPTLALQELMQRYLPRYLPALAPRASDEPTAPVVSAGPSDRETLRGQADLAAFLSLAQQDGRRLLVVQHPDRAELLTGQYESGYAIQAATLRGIGLDLIEMRPALAGTGEANYRDNIHHTPTGQRALADGLTALALPLLQSRTRQAATDS